jgi:hypothetical protein
LVPKRIEFIKKTLNRLQKNLSVNLMRQPRLDGQYQDPVICACNKTSWPQRLHRDFIITELVVSKRLRVSL